MVLPTAYCNDPTPDIRTVAAEGKAHKSTTSSDEFLSMQVMFAKHFNGNQMTVIDVFTDAYCPVWGAAPAFSISPF